MSFETKPKIFEDLDDALFDALPPNYRLMEAGSGFQTRFAECDEYQCTLFISPFNRLISRTHGRKPERPS